MFTGLIQDIGTVQRVLRGSSSNASSNSNPNSTPSQTGAPHTLWIRTAFPTSDLQLGESIAIDGACLTVVQTTSDQFQVQASPETLSRTTLGSLSAGSRVNLERAMQLSDRLGGHLLLGHVDAVTQILTRRADGPFWELEFALPTPLAPLFVEKGSVAVDGISLTVNQLTAGRFSVVIIPETQARTTFSLKKPGDRVNLEADLIGKYVARWHGLRQGVEAGLTEQALRRAGFGENAK